jgi:chorismate mutase/prephenate dehydratase
MVKKTPKTQKTKPRKRATPASLVRDRARMQRELVRLLNRYASLTKKLAGDLPPPPPRWQDAFEAALSTSKGPLPSETLDRMLRDLESASRQLVESVRVAYLGPPYSYSYLAAIKRFGDGVQLVPTGTIAAVFEEVSAGTVQYGLVPLENSTDGRVVDTLDMFARVPTRICDEVQLPIHHNLLGRCQRSEIREVYSKPQALSQCRSWLSKNLPGVRTVEMTSTAAAAQLAAARPEVAAVASLEAALTYGLDVLAENIEDRSHNVTRFAVIGDHISPRTGRDKTALMFEIAHRPGALADTMATFKSANINLTWIESFPMPEEGEGYLFFIEMEGHQQDARVKKALAALARRTLRLEILGSYPRSETPVAKASSRP